MNFHFFAFLNAFCVYTFFVYESSEDCADSPGPSVFTDATRALAQFRNSALEELKVSTADVKPGA